MSQDTQANTNSVLAFLLLALLASLITPASLDAASFDCARAKTRVEKLVCAEPELSNLDEELAEQYRVTVQSATSERLRTRIRQEQTNWLKRRDACTERRCVEEAYRARLDELVRLAVDSSSSKFRVTGKTYAQAAEARLPEPEDAGRTSFATFKLTHGSGVQSLRIVFGAAQPQLVSTVSRV